MQTAVLGSVYRTAAAIALNRPPGRSQFSEYGIFVVRIGLANVTTVFLSRKIIRYKYNYIKNEMCEMYLPNRDPLNSDRAGFWIEAYPSKRVIERLAEQ